MTVRWLGQDVFPIFTLPPINWPAGVTYPPAKPDWWPQGLQYPPIGEAWPATAPPWWKVGEQTGSLPKWPPPKPDNWPNNFPWPVPPTTVTNSLSCSDICSAQFGDKGTTPDANLLAACNTACQQVQFKVPSQAFVQPTTTTTTTTPTAAKKSGPSAGLVIVGVLALVGIGALVLSGGRS